MCERRTATVQRTSSDVKPRRRWTRRRVEGSSNAVGETRRVTGQHSTLPKAKKNSDAWMADGNTPRQLEQEQEQNPVMSVM